MIEVRLTKTMKNTVIDQCWDAFSSEKTRFASILLVTSIGGKSLDEVIELTPREAQDLLPNIILEWEITNTLDKPGRCICSAKITQQHIFFNKINKNKLTIGPECIKKYGSTSHKKYLSILTSEKKYSGDKLACCFCGAHRVSSDSKTGTPLCKACKTGGIDAPSTEYLRASGASCKLCKVGKVVPNTLILSCSDCATHKCALCSQAFFSNGSAYCPYCTELLRDWRICASCNKANIQVLEPVWKTKCAECYRMLPRKSQAMELETQADSREACHNVGAHQGGASVRGASYRACSSCNKNNISVDEPEWKTMCTACFKSSQARVTASPQASSFVRICCMCKKTKLDPSDPEWKTMCLPCFKYGR